jgi:rRNA-processing protein FCF1
MKKILVDTNFLIYCAKEKIDFFEYAKLEGLGVIIPEEVLSELSRLENTNQRKNVNVVKKILRVSEFEKISLKRTYVDRGIIEYLEDKKEIILATMDRDLQKKVKNPILSIREKVKFELFNR